MNDSTMSNKDPLQRALNSEEIPPEGTRIQGPQYWRSLDELADTPGFRSWLEREFPEGASEIEGVNRRHFLKIMAASFAMAGVGLAGCRRPEQRILPYSTQPERVIPGIPVFYATSMPRVEEHIPMVVETHEGRPTKLEGNAKYAPTEGSLDLQGQASILDLYDPDRATRSVKGRKPIGQSEVFDALSQLRKTALLNKGKGLAFLAEPNLSPVRRALQARLHEAFPEATWTEYSPSYSPYRDRASEKVYGMRIRPIYNFHKAKRILAIDADFMGQEAGALAASRSFSKSRRVKDPKEVSKMSRLYMVESRVSVSGTLADHRLRLSASQMPAFVAVLASKILKGTPLERFATELVSETDTSGVPMEWIFECARDLLNHPDKSLLMGGSHLPCWVQALIFQMNEALGARQAGLLELRRMPELPGALLSLEALDEQIQAGEVERLVILGNNVAYQAPGDLGFLAKSEALKEVFYLGYHADETAAWVRDHNGYFLARSHYLESWDLGRAWDGTLMPVQPMIRPLFEGMTENALIDRLLGGEGDDYALTKEVFAALSGDASDKAFHRFLGLGLLEESAYPIFEGAFQTDKIQGCVEEDALVSLTKTPDFKALEVRLVPDYSVGDGRFNNNGWLQECPDPISKLCWDNAIAISPVLAKEIGFDPRTQRALGISAKKSSQFEKGAEVAPLARLSVDGESVVGPLQIQPGLPDYTVLVTLGYGRRYVGRVGQGTGFSAYPLMRKSGFSYRGEGSLELLNETMRLANLQGHWSMEGRAIVREANADDFAKHPDFASKMGMESHSPAVYGADKDMPLHQKVKLQPRGNSLYKTPTFGGPQQWGMSIDLNLCNGCNACTVACQSENNIPIVGKDQVIRGREMHWIRIDRYYSSGDYEGNKNEIPSDPQISLMPVACQHCEMAPCEQVCPVNATVHDAEGLNVMAYNRCVGTRYCANNCPYKVRRFNFFDWNKREIGEVYMGPLGTDKNVDYGALGELAKMQKNPDVTVRMRGVMEKCNYCQQRIEQAKIAQKVKAGESDDILVPDGLIKTACQQSCPTDAIVFGDLADPKTHISQIKENPRDYALLGYLNVRPRTTYLARLRNQNPSMPDYRPHPLSAIEYATASKSGSSGDGHEAKEHH